MSLKVSAPVRIDISAGWSDAPPFVKDYGGAVLDGAINFRVSGSLENGTLSTSLDKVPSNSGLGTSGALRTLFLALSEPDLLKRKKELIKRVYSLENNVIGQRAGYQDQAAAIFGGVNFWTFSKNGKIKRRSVSKRNIRFLQDRLVLVFSGDKHQSSDVHEDVFSEKNYRKNIPVITGLKILAKEMNRRIRNVEKFSELMNETWRLEKKLDKNIESKGITKLARISKKYSLAYRATGAGGGGCVLFYCSSFRDKLNLMKHFEKNKKKVPKSKVLDFRFDKDGLKFEK